MTLPRPSRAASRAKGRPSTRLGDRLLIGITALAAALVLLLLIAIAIKVCTGARLSFQTFGLGFLTGTEWKPNFDRFGAATFIYGTIVSALIALVIAVPVGIAIGLYLNMLAPASIRRVVGPLVEMLAAIPSVILGFWGILIFGPFVLHHVEPRLHDWLGFLPIFGEPQTSGSSMFTAGLILTIMVIPIIASVSRDLFATVPRELQEGAEALGATPWEVIRGVMLPTTASGLAATSFLGLGRALGEAIAVTQVIGAGTAIKVNLFETGDTLASRIASQFQSANTQLQTSSLFYLAAVLLVIGLAANLGAQWIGRRFDASRVAR